MSGFVGFIPLGASLYDLQAVLQSLLTLIIRLFLGYLAGKLSTGHDAQKCP
jgi:hypothetical protein